jgi:hypothetical protein
MSTNKIIWSAFVLSNNDPLLLNRVRVSFNTKIDDRNNEDILKGVPKIYKTEDGGDLLPNEKWGKNDPFCFLPLLPIFLNVTPKEKEYVNLIWPNPHSKFQEQYYIQGTFSSPLTIFNESGEASRMFATRDRIVDARLLKNPGFDITKLGTTEFWHPPTKGVFPEPEDVAIIGRGTCDIVIQERHVLLRAGRSNTLPDNPKKQISAKSTRSFVDLADFDVKISYLGEKDNIKLEEGVSYVKTLIEWNILNPENQSDKFNFVVSLYRLPERQNYTTKNLNIDTDIPVTDKSLIYQIEFLSPNYKTKNEVIDYINTFIQQVNDGEINIPSFEIFPITNQFPCVYRPYKDTYNKLLLIGPSFEASTISDIRNNVGYKGVKSGFGKIYSTGNIEQPIIVKLDKTKEYSRVAGSSTFNLMGADNLYLLSHEQKIPNKGQITLGADTIYGIEQEYIVKNILPNTDPMVRGEQLMNFMNLVVRFLIGHVHSFPGLPPIPKSVDGVTAQKLLIELQNAPNTILNQNIRIN